MNSSLTTDERYLPQSVLVVGIDGSGKSTLLHNLSEQFGYLLHEPTSSPEARAFKESTIDMALSEDVVFARERIYANLNRAHQEQIQQHLLEGNRVATSGHILVTALSHAVMRRVISLESDNKQQRDAVMSVLENHELPATVCLMYAPFAVIAERIAARQEKGDVLEKFWGFNSLFFLMHYQDAWHDTLDLIGQETDVRCSLYDTSQLSPAAMLANFAGGHSL